MKISKGPPLAPRERIAPPSTVDHAAALALRALAYLAGDDEKIDRFLSLTGVDPGDLRSLAVEPAFLCAVLDHLAQDERLLLDFAAAEKIRPGAVSAARRALGGGDEV